MRLLLLRHHRKSTDNNKIAMIAACFTTLSRRAHPIPGTSTIGAPRAAPVCSKKTFFPARPLQSKPASDIAIHTHRENYLAEYSRVGQLRQHEPDKQATASNAAET
jgi:hypothetical protein